MDRCVIWGVGKDYEETVNQIKFEESKGNLEVVALVTGKDRRYGEMRDGYPLVRKNELQNLEYDFIIVVVKPEYMETVMQDIRALGIERKKVIDGKVFRLPLFDFKRYISLVKDPVTILSNDCWGGYIYHDLGLPFTSPATNIAWPIDSFCRFMLDPLYYLDQPLRMEREGEIRSPLWPIGVIGEGTREIKLNFVHSLTFAHAKEHWDRRRARVNPKRIFVKLTLNQPHRHYEAVSGAWNDEQSLAAFHQVTYPKVCFYTGETEQKDVIFLKRFEAELYNQKVPFVDYVDYGAYVRRFRTKDIDILKLLNGEPGYLRQN